MADLDTLSINLTASAQSANSKIDGLIGKLTALQNGLDKVSSSSFSAQMSSAATSAEKLANALANVNSASLKSTASGVNALAKAVKNLAAVDTSQLPTLSNNLQSLCNLNLSNLVSLGDITSAISKLGGASVAKAATALPQLTQALSSLSTVTLPDMTGFASLAQALRALGTKGIQNAAAALPTLADGLRQIAAVQMPNLGALGTLAQTLQLFGRINLGGGSGGGGSGLSGAASLIRNMDSALNKLHRTLQNIKQRFAGLQSKIKSSVESMKQFHIASGTAEKKTLSLAAAVGKLYAQFYLLFRLFRGIKSAIDAASDLVEVQNVVDVAFKNEKQVMEDFAKTSIQTYGMSELSAKQFASRFQAMGNAMGITTAQVRKAHEFLGKQGLTGDYADLGDSMANVSINLTKLTADMASLYNQEYADVAKDLEAILTGMTRPLRTYGLDLTNATLQEWAMKNGIDANIKSMSQAEKTMLRYQYVLSQTKDAQGDFARTAGRLCAA